jgi:transcriptional regulator with XRE-family HTH domain
VPKDTRRAIDRAIGGRLKFYRNRAGLSQGALGQHLDVTFQQIQKYENGTNRLSAASMMKAVRVLCISIDDLLLPRAKNRGTFRRGGAIRFAKSSEGRDLIRHFLAIKDPYLRRQIMGLVRTLGQFPS